MTGNPADEGKTPLRTTISGAKLRRAPAKPANLNAVGPSEKQPRKRRVVQVSTPKPVKPVVESKSAEPSPTPEAQAAKIVPAIARQSPPPAKPQIAAVTAEKKQAEPPNSAALSSDDRLKARADLASVYAGLLGRDAVLHDLVDAMQSALAKGREDSSFSLLSVALTSLGLEADIEHNQPCSEKSWPALALMTNGQAVMVLSQDGDHLRVYEAGANGASIEVEKPEFARVFTGTVLRAEVPISDLAARHAPRSLQDHWFWGELPKFKRYFGDVALGSFVANLLAVAVALFSLQVYDRVIPHQSTATLWVLAAGAFVAILLEAGIKAARARLMDGAGRAIEMNVQRLLMDRILGMRSDARPTSPSSLFSSMREFGSVREFFTASSVGTLTDLPFIFLFLALVASIAGNVVWVLIAGGILMVLPGFSCKNG